MLSTTLVIPSKNCWHFSKSNLKNVRSILKPLARMQTSWHIHLKKHWKLARTLVANFHLTMYNNQCWVVRTPLARALSVLQFVNQKKYANILSRTQVVMIYLFTFINRSVVWLLHFTLTKMCKISFFGMNVVAKKNYSSFNPFSSLGCQMISLRVKGIALQ